MEGISFDSLSYLPDDSFVIECNDDFGGICEDIVCLANATHLVDQLDPSKLASGNESPPSSSYYSSARCFDKEIPSLFSEMEYLTEVSPDTEMAIVPAHILPVAVDPSEFAWSRREEVTNEINGHDQQFYPHTDSSTNTSSCNQYPISTNYRTILQNYIQKGKRKLEQSTYSKMKAICVKSNNNSTSLVETVTSTSYGNPPNITATKMNPPREPSEGVPSDSALVPNFRCRDCNCCFLSVERLKKHPCIIAVQYQCQLCRREFRKKKTLEQHIKTHNKVFSTDADLRKW
ncbi:early growth response protein 1-like isoform X2 [Wyeomyia smithii]|uniref:early growth response protein 1-like isoform X2 n=1 Tax=Wyeomyia smithii TaxID=174621 RepID=UPI002467E6B7|nr:early growth response protein 1-like isoform X2 [Wyeomyia smithii]